VSVWEIAEAEGLSNKEDRKPRFSFHDAALKDAVIKGWFTPEQAEWMNEQINQMWEGDCDHRGGLSWNEAGFDGME